MNNEQRKQLAANVETLNNVQIEIQDIRDEQEESLNNLPEGFQNGDRGGALQNAMDELDVANDMIENALEAIANAVNV